MIGWSQLNIRLIMPPAEIHFTALLGCRPRHAASPVPSLRSPAGKIASQVRIFRVWSLDSTV